MYYVYILKCCDDTLYTGWTTDIDRRVKEHNTSYKGSKYTRARRPVELCYAESCNSKSDAAKRECEIKKLTRRQKLELVSSYHI